MTYHGIGSHGRAAKLEARSLMLLDGRGSRWQKRIAGLTATILESTCTLIHCFNLSFCYFQTMHRPLHPKAFGFSFYNGRFLCSNRQSCKKFFVGGYYCHFLRVLLSLEVFFFFFSLILIRLHIMYITEHIVIQIKYIKHKIDSQIPLLVHIYNLKLMIK